MVIPLIGETKEFRLKKMPSFFMLKSAAKKAIAIVFLAADFSTRCYLTPHICVTGSCN